MKHRRGAWIGIFNAAQGVIVFTFLLGFFGLLTIYSSQSNSLQPFLLASRQLFHLAFAIVAMLVAAKIPFDFYRRNVFVLALLAYIGILALPLAGTRINGTCGWFRFGSWCFQPTEPAKVFYLLLLVQIFCKMRDSWSRFLSAFGISLMWLIPIYFQPDFGMTVIYLSAFAITAFLAGSSWKQWGSLLVAGTCGSALFISRYSYAWRRLTGFWAPESDPTGSGWHVRQFGLTIARGGWGGSKIGGAVWSNSYLPLPYNDSAYATLIETLGLAGGILTALLFAGLLVCLFILGSEKRLHYDNRLFIYSAIGLASFQALLHVSVNVCLLPPTGLTLPLISYGGSSLLGCGLLFGIVLSASRPD